MKTSFCACGGAVALFSITFTSVARADEPAPAPADPAAQPAPAPAVEDPAPPPARPAPAAVEAPKGDDDLADKTRFRIAGHLLGGPWFVGDHTGGGGGAGIQIGAQINDFVGVYYAGTAAIGVAGSSGTTGSGTSAGAFVYNSVVVDATFARVLQIGVGPSLDSFAFGSATVSTGGSSSAAIAGTFIGLHGRVGVALGPSRPGKRSQFMLGLEVHPSFLSGVTPVSTFLTLGGGSF